MKIEITVEGNDNTMFDWSVSNFPGRFSFLDRMTRTLIEVNISLDGFENLIKQISDKVNISKLNREHIYEVIDSLHTTITTDSKDWSLNKRDAWIYGIIVGWDDALPEVAEKFGWGNEDINRLKKYHSQFQKIKDTQAQFKTG